MSKVMGVLHCDVNNETISCKMISNEGKVWDEFTITPGNPPKSQQNPTPAPKIVTTNTINRKAISTRVSYLNNKYYQ